MTDSLNRVVIIDNRLHDPVRNQDYDLIASKGLVAWTARSSSGTANSISHCGQTSPSGANL